MLLLCIDRAWEPRAAVEMVNHSPVITGNQALLGVNRRHVWGVLVLALLLFRRRSIRLRRQLWFGTW